MIALVPETPSGAGVARGADRRRASSGTKGRRLLSILNKKKLERVLAYLLDENEFLGPYGIRSLSRYHLEHPFTFWVGHQEYKVQYLPAESNTGMFGGNSNWRGPVWMPVNALIVRALLNLYAFYGDDFKVECPTGSGRHDDAVRGGPGDLPAAGGHVPARRQRTAAGLRRDDEVPGGSALARPDPLLRVLPRRQRRGARGQPPDRLDRPRRSAARSLRAHRCQGRARDRAGRPAGPRGHGAGGGRTGSRPERDGREAHAGVVSMSARLLGLLSLSWARFWRRTDGCGPRSGGRRRRGRDRDRACRSRRRRAVPRAGRLVVSRRGARACSSGTGSPTVAADPTISVDALRAGRGRRRDAGSSQAT